MVVCVEYACVETYERVKVSTPVVLISPRRNRRLLFYLDLCNSNDSSYANSVAAQPQTMVAGPTHAVMFWYEREALRPSAVRH